MPLEERRSAKTASLFSLPVAKRLPADSIEQKSGDPGNYPFFIDSSPFLRPDFSR
jgi:hypothetical protein